MKLKILKRDPLVVIHESATVLFCLSYAFVLEPFLAHWIEDEAAFTSRHALH